GDDDDERQRLDHVHAAGAGLVLIGRQRGTAGDVGGDARRRRDTVDGLLHRLDRFVGQRLALVAGGVDLHVGALAVRALGAGRGQPVAPEVLDVFDVDGVGLEFGDDLVVVVVSFSPQGAVRLVA